MQESWALKYLNKENDVCWFCKKGDCDEFDTEFDTFVHYHCVKDSVHKFVETGADTEAIFMTYLIKPEDIPHDLQQKIDERFLAEWE